VAFGAALIALFASDDIDDDTAVVLAAGRAGAVRLALGSAFAYRDARSRKAMMRTALGALGSVLTHSYDHSDAIIQSFQYLATGCKSWPDGPRRAPSGQLRGDA
jgi:hypothetical protein